MASTIDASRHELIALNAISGAELGRVPILAEPQLRELVERCRALQAVWAKRSVRERGRRLKRLRRLIVDHMDELAELISAETGKPAGESIGGEILVTLDHLAYVERMAPFVLSGRVAGTSFFYHRRARVTYEPYGVIGVITPWNYPFTLGMGAAIAALAGGNAVILKPSEYTPLVGVRIGELIAEATGLEDLATVATGDKSTGEALVRSGVDKIAFTGSARAGISVMKTAADSLTPVVLELGGKDAMIVCADADLERAARGAVWGAFYGCGEICQSVERAYVVEPVYDEFVRRVVGEARRVKTSDEPEANIGPLIADFQLAKVRAHVWEAKEKGARVLLGGRELNMPGHFFEPTVLADVDHSMQVMTDETFGPVLPIMKVASEEEAVRLTNDSEFGLDASIWTRDRARGRRIADRLEVGSVLINDHLINRAMAEVPFGGIGHSGFGRVHGLEGLREFTRTKSWVEDRMTLKREPHWFSGMGSGEASARALIRMRHSPSLIQRSKGALEFLREYLS